MFQMIAQNNVLNETKSIKRFILKCIHSGTTKISDQVAEILGTTHVNEYIVKTPKISGKSYPSLVWTH